MKQILEHFSPAIIYLAVSVFIIAIFAVLLTTDGPIAQAFQNCITSAISTLMNAFQKP